MILIYHWLLLTETVLFIIELPRPYLCPDCHFFLYLDFLLVRWQSLLVLCFFCPQLQASDNFDQFCPWFLRRTFIFFFFCRWFVSVLIDVISWGISQLYQYYIIKGITSIVRLSLNSTSYYWIPPKLAWCFVLSFEEEWDDEIFELFKLFIKSFYF